MKPRSTFEKRRKEEARKTRQQEKAERRATRKLNRENEPTSTEETVSSDAMPDEPERMLTTKADNVVAQ